jgi:hypothetical protein
VGILLPTPLLAAWTGISFSIGDETIPLINNTEELILTPFYLKLSTEEKISGELRFGAHVNKIEVDIKSNTQSINTAADTIGFYLYLPYQFNKNIGLISKVSITKALPNPTDEEEGEVSYLTKKITLGLSFRLLNWRITPSVTAFNLTGDFHNSDNTNTFDFNEKQTRYTSLSIDYLADRQNFVRFSVTEHSDKTFGISFISRY